ncbi:hypothetical protein NA57DRAFT_70854 [Rhizodiscina lignyota]|uniref:EthD domain-containing protein n=1 Tax=Rhizodiscina lignyota TaxID=1504668 RepID=A0A9P4IR88_9PEZI|nr:hypothetical protein NA57DRAFT_70854 [Rhizodiscina lignyota]
MAPGILWVSSRITQPSALPREKFTSWYEDVHIHEVVALSRVPAAARYEAVQGIVPDDAPYLNKADWLTVYEMEDVGFRFSPEFKGLDGQTKPKGNLLEEVFSKARFETRFAEERQVDEREGARKGPAPLLISAFLKPPKDAASEEEFDRFYREEHIPLISKVPGYVRTRRYRLCPDPESSSVLHEFQREDVTHTTSPTWLALHEFDLPQQSVETVQGFPMKDLIKTDETEWAKSVVGRLEGMEAGWFKLKRVYGEWEKYAGGGVSKGKL